MQGSRRLDRTPRRRENPKIPSLQHPQNRTGGEVSLEAVEKKVLVMRVLRNLKRILVRTRCRRRRCARRAFVLIVMNKATLRAIVHTLGEMGRRRLEWFPELLRKKTLAKMIRPSLIDARA